MLCNLKFYFKKLLGGKECQYTTRPFLFFPNKIKPKNKKNH